MAVLRSNTLRTLTNKIPRWRYDPDVSRKNGCRVYRLDYANETALASRDNCPERGPGWRVQVIGQRVYHYSDRLTLAQITDGVAQDIEALPPLVVIETPTPANALEDLADALPDTGHRMTDFEDRQPW